MLYRKQGLCLQHWVYMSLGAAPCRCMLAQSQTLMKRQCLFSSLSTIFAMVCNIMISLVADSVCTDEYSGLRIDPEQVSRSRMGHVTRLSLLQVLSNSHTCLVWVHNGAASPCAAVGARPPAQSDPTDSTRRNPVSDKAGREHDVCSFQRQLS